MEGEPRQNLVTPWGKDSESLGRTGQLETTEQITKEESAKKIMNSKDLNIVLTEYFGEYTEQHIQVRKLLEVEQRTIRKN